MGLITLISRRDEANHRNPTDGDERMGTMADRILMLVVSFPQSNAVVGKYPVTVLIFLSPGTSHGLEKGRVSYKNDFTFHNLW